MCGRDDHADRRGGEVWPIEIDPTLRIYLSGGGYTSTNTRSDRFTEPIWHAPGT